MANCEATLAFLTDVKARNVVHPLPPADVANLAELGLVRTLTADEHDRAAQEVAGLSSLRDEIVRDGSDHARLQASVESEARHAGSFLFRFEHADRQAAERAKLATDTSALTASTTDLTAHEQAFARLVAQKALLDAAAPYAGGFVGLTGLGEIAARDLGVRMYRVSAVDFTAYWHQAQQVERELNDLANLSASFAAPLAAALPDVDRSYLWAIAIGLAKLPGPAEAKVPTFLAAFNALAPLASNPENQLLAAEILSCAPAPAASTLPLLHDLDRQVRSAGVPREASLGVAAILLLGRRADGTFATGLLPFALRLTPSNEAAALLAVINSSWTDLEQRFAATRARFASWGYQPSEDVELAAAYLTVSDLPIDTVGTKLALIARGLSTYLQYPLVPGAILTSIPTLEANETLRLLEHAYEILGRRTGPTPPPELLTLAVRLIHGVRVASVDELDPTAAAGAAPVGFTYTPRPGFFFVPLIVAHGRAFGTFGGVHPGHVHGWGGGFSG